METKKKPKKIVTHPKYREMILTALDTMKDRTGSSRQAIIRYIMTYFDVGDDAKKVNMHVKLSLRAGLKSEIFKQVKGTGASGSFKRGDAAKKDKPKVKKTAKDTAESKSKKPSAPKLKPKVKANANIKKGKQEKVKDKKKSPKRKAPVGKVAEKKVAKQKKSAVPKTPKKKLQQAQKLKTPKKPKAR